MTMISIAPEHGSDEATRPLTVVERITRECNERLDQEAELLKGALDGRNGYRTPKRGYDTVRGTVRPRIPKFNKGSMPAARVREIVYDVAGGSIDNLVTTLVVKGVATRNVEDVTTFVDVERMSKSKVSRITGPRLDAIAEQLNARPLDHGPYRFVQADAMVIKARDGGRVVFVHVLIVIGLNADSRWEILGFDVTSAENGSGWTGLLRSLVERGLSGVRMVTADKHTGLWNAVGLALPGAVGQEDFRHFRENLLDRVPRSGHETVGKLLDSILAQKTRRGLDRKVSSVIKKLATTYPDAAKLLTARREEVTAYRTFPPETWQRIRTSNRTEGLNSVIRHRVKTAKSFQSRKSITRMVAGILNDQQQKLAQAPRCITLDVLGRCDPLGTTGATGQDTAGKPVLTLIA